MNWYQALVRQVCATAAAVGVLAGGAAFAADPVFPPGSSIGLVPPKGMTAATSFAGFQHELGASIVVVEMPPEAYEQIVAKFTPETLKPTGFIVSGASETLKVNGGNGVLLRGTQSANGLDYAKWVAVVKSPANTGLVTVQVPEDARAQVSDAAVESALKSIAFRAEQSMDEQMAALPFSVGDLAGFRPVRVIGGSGLLLTDGPKDVDPDGNQPFVIVAASLGREIAPDEQAAFAKRALSSLAQVTDIKVDDETRSTKGKATVFQHHASAKDAKSSADIKVTQTVIYADGKYVRVIGIARADKADAIARADKLADTVAVR
ncbi:hypothetical protein ACLBXM_09475 [Xanthobacteraceae bacterium A53D]